MKRILINTLIFVGLTAVVFAVFNYQYFRKNISYDTENPRVETKIAATQVETESVINPNQLQIPSLDITAPIVYIDNNSENAFQIGLQSGVVHYPDTSLPGETGNVYIFGHSSDFSFNKGDYKTVFAVLPKIQKGAYVSISDNQGKLYTYQITETKIISAKDTSVLAQPSDKKLLTLQTSYPVGTALKRFIAIGELIDDN